MSKVWLIIKREYLSRVRKKSFLVTTLLAPLGLVLLMATQIFFMTRSAEEKTILLKDESGYFTETRGAGVQAKLKDEGTMKFKATKEDLEVMQENYAERGYSGVLYVPPIKNLKNPPDITFYSDKLLGLGSRMELEDKLALVLKNEKIKQAGLDQQTLEDLKTTVSIRENTGGEEGKESSSMIAAGISYIIGFIMYLSIIIYGTMVMRGVMEEKTNRIVEVILSSVKPFQLMLGKIIGIGGVGLTQFLIWIITVGILYIGMMFFVGLTVDPDTLNNAVNSGGGMAASGIDSGEMQMKMAEMLNSLSSINWPFLAFAFVFYYLGGYLFYSALFAAIGSAMGDDSSSSESQALVMPVTIPIIISFFILIAIMENPNGSLAFWSSICPFSSSIIMPARIAYGLSPFTIDFFLSVAFLIGGFIFTTWFASKIYRTGILMIGKKVSFREMAKWIRQS